MNNDNNNHAMFTTNNNKSSLQFDRHNIQPSSTSVSLTGNGGVSITSLFIPATINMTMKKKNGTGYTDIKRTRQSLSETAQ